MSIGFSKVENLCSMVKNRFPYTSPWELRQIEIRQLKTALEKETDSFVKQNLSAELQKLTREYEQQRAFSRFINASCLKSVDRPAKYYKNLMESIDFFKTFWCGAAAKLMYMASRINGVAEGDVQRAFATLNDGKAKIGKEVYGNAYVPERLDHTVNVINTLDGIAEADALFGKVYREGEMHKVLETDYREALNLPAFASVKICPENNYPVKFQDMPHLSSKEVDQLSESYPELII